MDIDDPIQQLLKNTGWSCDDLLEKLQKYKYQKETNKDQSESFTETDNIKLNSEKRVCDTPKFPTINYNEKTNKTNTSENSITILGEEFSDTDEEEVEVNVTNSNIIDEIIDDIASADNAEELNDTIENRVCGLHRNNEEQEEITEVRVIELNNDEEDDCFDEECTYNATKHNMLDSENVEYLETFPRKATLTLKPIDLTDNGDKDDTLSERNVIDEKYEQEKNIFNIENVIENFTSEENSNVINNTKNLDTCQKGIISIEHPNDEITNRFDEENTSRSSTRSKQVTEHSLGNKTDERDTTIIYEKNCEKVLKSNNKINDSDSTCKITDQTESVPLNFPLSNNNQENRTFVEEESTLTNLEDIRNNLKLQLNSLRTRKKGHFLQQLTSRFVDSSECNKEKFKKVNFESKDTTSEIADCFKNLSRRKENDKEHDLYTQTNEFGLVILSVQGGIDLEEQNNECNKQCLDEVNENSSNTVNSTLDNSIDSSCLVSQNNLENNETNEVSEAFDEIRRIIQKQKKNNSKSEKKNITGVICNRKFNCFPKSTDIPSSESKTEFNEKTDYPSTSADNSQSSFANDDTGQNTAKNSPFISNTLDEFLTGNSKLNISYKVPKSGAEEGLVDSYREKSPLMLKKIVKAGNEDIPVSKKTEKIKAKTVAQKRKLLEKQRLKELKKQAKFIKQQSLNNNNTNKERKCSYIELNNKKLWVRGTKPNICIAKIKSPLNVGPSLKQYHRKRKLSLLEELTKKCNEKIKYLPGPLSKKSTLQINGLDNWKTKTKLLPKIILEVTPKIGQCLVPDIIRRLPQCDGVVTADLAEFALSVLKTKTDTNTEEKTFKFPMRYINNQENIIVKKKRITSSNYKTEEKLCKDICTDVIANVIDDLIRYVEIKEIAPTLIKEEETEYNCNDGRLDKIPEIAESISSIIKKPQKKKSKVELELLRLSCKVVNVEVEENYIEESCNKPYCRLGCVCKSLKCDGIMTYHCQNVSCMLECKCPREKSMEYDKLMLPPGTDILSKDAVTRIEDEAKKDLAKVEREFTQMVIHTNDKTIVVGTGGRHKTRRCTKAPIKYSDYIDSNFECMEEDGKTTSQEKKKFTKECFISLEKLHLQDIIPYCMFHNLYDCHCERRSPPLSNIRKILSKSSSEENSEKPTLEKKYPKSIKSTAPKQPRIPKESPDNSDISVNQNLTDIKMISASGRPIRINKKLKDDFACSDELNFQLIGCARTLGVSFYMKTRHRRSMKILNKITKEDFCNNITQSDILKTTLFKNSPGTLEVDILKHQLILESESHKKSVTLFIENALTESKRKRKQVLEVRNDDNLKPSFNQDLAIQRRKKPALVTRRDPVRNPIESVFEGEIIVDERNMELLQKMGNRTVLEGYARLLPWTALINSFNKEDIKIWCMVDQPSRLLINKGDKSPPKNYIDIRQTTQTTEVILWILTNKLPRRYHEDHVSFILKQTKDNYEICGLCTKNLNNTNCAKDIYSENELSTQIDKDMVLFKHKDLNGTQQLMCVSKGRFKLQELVEENLAAVGETSVEKNKLYMWAALPEIYRMCKWRMIFLNSDFTFLYFTRVKYSIKYTDLLSVSNKAKEANCTIILRNSIICHPYDHSAFGIYFDAHYQDRLFIGPYFKQHKDDDVETLRYINQSLVCTESFNKMQGKINYKCGHWLIERPYCRTSERPTIDLTQDTLLAKGLKRKKSEDCPQIVKKQKLSTSVNEKIIITQNNDRIKVLDSEPKKPEEFNRYIITNIPHLGYLGAFQHEESTEIDVSWPFENKMLRFPTVSSATNFLQCRFSSLLQPVPETFRISIIVLTHIDLEKTRPIDVSILSGHYICGEFGCYNVKTITNEFCVNTIGTTREELLRIFARRAQKFVRQKIEELANIVNISHSEERYDIVNILNKAQKEIQSFAQMEKQYIAEKNYLTLRKRELAAKVLFLISSLPEHKKSGENWKFRQILRKKSILMPQTVMEPIEIPDSDEEDRENTFSKNDDHHSDVSEITSLPKLNPIKGPPSNQSALLKPTMADKNFSNKVTQRTVITYPPRRKLKSILKSNTTTASSTPMISKVERPGSVFSQSLDSTSNSSKQHYLTGVKLIKTCEGKLMLVSDDRSISGKPFKIESAGGKQLVIKNNQVLSVKSISPIKNDGVQNITVSEMMPTKIPSSPPKTIILKKSALLKSPTVFPTNNKIVTSLFHNKINENSLLKTPLAMPDIIPIKHNTNIYKSNDNEIVEISPSNEETEKQTLVKDNSKTTTSIFKDIEMKNINTDINPFLEKFNNPEFTEIPTSVCNTTDIFIETPSGNTVKENLTSNKESIFLESNTDNESNGEKSKINKGGPVSRELLPQIITESDKNEPTKFNKPPIKPPDIQFNEDSNNKCEILCNSNAESPLKNDEVASESSTPLKIINTVEENSDSETATFSTLESNIMKESNVTNTEKKSDVGDNVENIMNEKSNNLTENNDLTSNTEKPFLVNVVSEIFLSKTDNEMSTQTSAAALTQMKDAANDNFNLSLLSKEAEKKHFTIVESNEQNSFASKILKSVPSINETDICTDIETQRPLINTTKECDVSSNKNNKTLNSLSPKPADEIKVLNSVNEETISKTTLLPNKESNFFDTNSEITSETSVEKAFHERGICLEHSKEQINSSSTNQKSSKLLNNRQCNKELPEITVKIDNKDDSNLSYVNKQSSVKNHTDVNKTIKQNSVVERTEVNMEEKNSNSVESEYENSKINNNSNSHKTDKNTLVQIKCDITKACSKEDILPTVVSNDFPYIDNINSVSQTIIDKNDSKTQTSNEKDDFKDTNNVKIAAQIDKQVCTENIEADNHSKSQIISNLVDHEALMKICSDAIKNECTKANIETVKKINVSVSVTISTQINQNSPEENSKEVTSIVKHNNSSKCNSHQIKYNVLPTNTKKLLCKHALRNKHKSRSLKNVKKNLIKNSLLNKTTKKFHKTPRQISPTSTEFLKRHNLFRRMKNKQRKTDSARQIVCKRQSNKTCKDEKMPLHKKNADLWNKSISETQEAKIPIIKSDGNIDTTPEILSEIDSKSESQISPLQAPPKIFNEIPRSTKYIVKSKYHKNMSTNHNECNVLQTNIKALNTSLPLSQDTDVGNDKQFAFCKFIIKSNEGSNEINSDVSSNENNNKELSLNTDTTVLTGATTKFPLSKRISNVVIHTLHTQNSTNDYNFAKENAEPSTNMENNMTNTVDLSSHETDTTSSKICTSKLLSTDQNKNVTQMLLTNRNDVKENKNKSRNILASKRASLKRTIKFVSAKVNNVFTIDNDSFSKDSKRTSQSIQKSKTTYQKQSPIFDSNVRIKLLQRLQGNEKKGLPYDRGRIRKEGISTSDIICASKILRSKNMKCKNNDIAIKICALAENTAKVNDVVSIIDKKSFLKNAKLAEKFINIENMKKKLHANICEDSDCKNPK